MNCNILLDLATDLGYELAMSGAETFRVEESIQRVLNSYHMDCDVFAIPNFLVVSITDESGKPYTKMRRIGNHGNNLDAVEKFNALSRRICAEQPDPTEAMQWLEQSRGAVRHYPFPYSLCGEFGGAFGFSLLFGCNFPDAILSGLCGVIMGLVDHFTRPLRSNPLFSTFLSAFLSALFSYTLSAVGLARDVDAINIGALMILVPGLLFINALRDLIYGDVNSGINRMVQVVFIAVAIAIGNGVAWNVVTFLLPFQRMTFTPSPSLLITAIGTLIGCMGFSVSFNIHGPGGLLCALGGLLTWLLYNLCLRLGGTDLTAYFYATVFAALYAESMARIRKYPAISYLVVSIFPLLPGAGVYYTMRYVLVGNMQMFVKQGMQTLAIAGVIAVGILLASTSVRFYTNWRLARKH